MQTKQRRPAPGRNRADRAKQRYFFKQNHHNKHAGNSKQKNHWSRRPEQRKRDAAILASLGLGFEPVGTAMFHLLQIMLSRRDQGMRRKNEMV